MTQEELKKILYYAPETGNFYWKISNGQKLAWSLAGSLGVDGHIKLCINYTSYRANRLAWIYMTGEIPSNNIQVDHKNRIRTDNRWDNLRLATNSQNNRNRNLLKNNTSGYRGVAFNKQANKWQAQIRYNNRRKNLGHFNTAEEASKAYMEAAVKFHGEFASHLNDSI